MTARLGRVRGDQREQQQQFDTREEPDRGESELARSSVVSTTTTTTVSRIGHRVSRRSGVSSSALCCWLIMAALPSNPPTVRAPRAYGRLVTTLFYPGCANRPFLHGSAEGSERPWPRRCVTPGADRS